MNLKKPKFWDLKEPNLKAYLLLPLTFILRISNFILKFTNKKKFRDIKTICVGNIYTGGTGKTPTTLYIYEMMKKLNLNAVTAKKFYSDQLDEVKLLKRKSELISLKQRVEIVKTSIEKNYDVIIFDDGLQEKFLDYDIKFVCFDARKWIGNGCLIPSGPLRENIESLKKYDAIFIKNTNKHNNLTKIYSKVKEINPKIEIFNTYVEIKNIEKFNLNDNYLIFSGIGNSESFRETLTENKFKIVEELIFPDHYEYKEKDITKILDKAKIKGSKIVTTEKDYIKIVSNIKDDINFIEIDFNVKNNDKLEMFIKSKINETN